MRQTKAATPQEPMTPRVFTKTEFGQQFNLSRTTVDRAVSHGLVKVIYFGDRPLIPVGECERIAREGLPSIPPGYKRQTDGPTNAGRPKKRQRRKAS
jgi:hypothetical protein